MYYRNGGNWQNGPWRRRRGMRGIYGFPWILFVFFIIFSHSMIGFMIAIGIAVGLSILFAALLNGGSPWMGMRYQQPYQAPYQPPYQAPRQQSYQPPYQPYEQGYQAPPPQETYQEGGRQYESAPPQQSGQYPEYEQPHSQYPEQMPPMQ